MVVDSIGDRNYVYKSLAHRLQITQHKENAYQYSSLKAAQAALKKILDKYPKIHRAEVIIL